MAKILVRHGSIAPNRRATLVTHLLADAILGKVLPALAASGIRALPVKGVVTAYELYDDVSERPITDIDIRVLPEQLEDVVATVMREKWDLLRYSKPYQNVVFRLEGFTLDVETAVGPPGLCGLRVRDMLARAERGGAHGYAHLKPEIHDHALLLCVNLFKDKLTYAAPWAVRDVERIAQRNDFDLDRFVALAKKGEVSALVWIVADWMATAQGSGRWADVRTRIGAPPRRLYTRLFRWLVRRDDNSLAMRLFARAGSDSRVQQARALLTAVAWELDAKLNQGARLG